MSANDLTLQDHGLPAGVRGLFFFGSERVALPFGDGMRCVGGRVTRFAPIRSDSLGVALESLDFTAAPFVGKVAAGEALNFQFWYRDPAGPGGAHFNLSSALAFTPCP